MASKVNVLPLLEKICVDDPPMVERSAATARPVLAGFAPGVTFTVRSVESPPRSELGLADPVPDGGVGARTVNAMLAVARRPSPSVMVAARTFAPPAVPSATTASNEKTLSPAVTSP